MFYVYILSNRTGQLDAGVTHHIGRSLQAYRLDVAPACIQKHSFNRLLLLESFSHSTDAAARQRQLNSCTLTEKLEVIRGVNPRFDDLAQTL